MSNPLAVYLHDHLSAANFAMELLEKMGCDDQKPNLRDFARGLREEVAQDRMILRQIAEKVGATSHSLKEAIGWLGEKASRYKLSHEVSADLATFESLEVLTLGVWGKLALWNALKRVAVFDPRLAEFDFTALCSRAETQHAELEVRRIAAVAGAFRDRAP